MKKSILVLSIVLLATTFLLGACELPKLSSPTPVPMTDTATSEPIPPTDTPMPTDTPVPTDTPTDAPTPTWHYTNANRQRPMEPGEPRQMDYDTGQETSERTRQVQKRIEG